MSDTMLRPIEDSRMRQALQEEFARIEQAMEQELPILGPRRSAAARQMLTPIGLMAASLRW